MTEEIKSVPTESLESQFCKRCGHATEQHDIEPPYSCNWGIRGLDANNVEVDAFCDCGGFSHVPSVPTESRTQTGTCDSFWRCAINLCHSEANRWKSADPKTSAHWTDVAALLEGQYLASRVRQESAKVATSSSLLPVGRQTAASTDQPQPLAELSLKLAEESIVCLEDVNEHGTWEVTIHFPSAIELIDCFREKEHAEECAVFWREHLSAIIRRAMLEFAERAEKATCAFCRSGAELVGKQHRLLTSEHNTTASSYSYYSYIDCDAAAIRELAEGLKENQK